MVEVDHGLVDLPRYGEHGQDALSGDEVRAELSDRRGRRREYRPYLPRRPGRLREQPPKLSRQIRLIGPDERNEAAAALAGEGAPRLGPERSDDALFDPPDSTR